MQNLPEILGAIIVLAPIVIFLITMMVIRKSLSAQNVHLGDLLQETEVVINRQDIRAETAAGEPATEPPVKRSASRLILFISGVTSLILGACMTTYYFYMNIYCIACSTPLAMEDFTNILLALGIGVIPYSINQVKKFKL